MTRQKKILLLTVLALCEISCLLFARYSVSVATIIYTLSGVGMCIIALTQTSGSVPESIDSFSRYSYLLYIATSLLICHWTINVFRSHIHSTPLDVNMGDMLLYIREMSERYLAHLHVYEPISDINGYNVKAVYLPSFWLPYTIPLCMGIDMRWGSLVCFISSILIVTVVRRRYFSFIHFVLLMPLTLFVYMLLSGAAYYLMFTREAVVLFYVALLCRALIAEYWVAAGIAAALCITSRYFIGAPLLGGLIWLYFQDRSIARRIIFATLSTLIVILTVSRSWGDLIYFFKIPFLYIGLLNDTSSLEKFRYILYYGSVGFASFLHGDDIQLIVFVNIAVLLLIPICYFLFAHRYLSDRKKGLVILCGIKFFLILFLTTLTHPYGYVVYTSSLVSIALLKAIFS